MSILPAGVFCSQEVVAAEVELANGNKYTLHFREPLAGDFEDWQKGDNQSEAVAALIAKTLVTPDGLPGITIEEARLLKTAPKANIFRAILTIASVDPGKL